MMKMLKLAQFSGKFYSIEKQVGCSAKFLSFKAQLCMNSVFHVLHYALRL